MSTRDLENACSVVAGVHREGSAKLTRTRSWGRAVWQGSKRGLEPGGADPRPGPALVRGPEELTALLRASASLLPLRHGAVRGLT